MDDRYNATKASWMTIFASHDLAFLNSAVCTSLALRSLYARLMPSISTGALGENCIAELAKQAKLHKEQVLQLSTAMVDHGYPKATTSSLENVIAAICEEPAHKNAQTAGFSEDSTRSGLKSQSAAKILTRATRKAPNGSEQCTHSAEARIFLHSQAVEFWSSLRSEGLKVQCQAGTLLPWVLLSPGGSDADSVHAAAMLPEATPPKLGAALLQELEEMRYQTGFNEKTFQDQSLLLRFQLQFFILSLLQAVSHRHLCRSPEGCQQRREELKEDVDASAITSF
eukprot:CAMPEP_0197642832 /NCGR_PEP_ID=MMETSP1338-20131121/16374_1 /TAXON_ID=43686 ORGANISM="Pelagodinium beii, Strain RCC1491" /NCGR_SAMPLE_ID=MMETSP1338 /ASSEMBLY_ACC=CAM_ASM_000754 /LENGTH=282 /DNA_ID=CAMNT_0043216015 /DNA_START=298 /DNA_END=1149 /DNA_ORIENTATION=-